MYSITVDFAHVFLQFMIFSQAPYISDVSQRRINQTQTRSAESWLTRATWLRKARLYQIHFKFSLSLSQHARLTNATKEPRDIQTADDHHQKALGGKDVQHTEASGTIRKTMNNKRSQQGRRCQTSESSSCGRKRQSRGRRSKQRR